MLSLKQFLSGLEGDAATDEDDEVVRTTVGLDVAAVMLPNEILTEDRVSRMNALWDLLGEREALVVAVSARSERLAAAIGAGDDVGSSSRCGNGSPVAGRQRWAKS